MKAVGGLAGAGTADELVEEAGADEQLEVAAVDDGALTTAKLKATRGDSPTVTVAAHVAAALSCWASKSLEPLLNSCWIYRYCCFCVA